MKGIPLNLYARESMIPHLEKYADFIFEITDQCMQLFEKFFGYPYPFEKYDQIFCPEFNCGAMGKNEFFLLRESFNHQIFVMALKRTQV